MPKSAKTEKMGFEIAKQFDQEQGGKFPAFEPNKDQKKAILEVLSPENVD
jgi:hypothetical protein